MKLLLDEHYSPDIARRLRATGHDVVSVKERKDLTGLPDAELLRRMADEKRTLLTNNVADFLALADQAILTDEGHGGLLFTSDRSMPRRKDAIGLFVRVLDTCLRENQEEGVHRNRVRRLP